MIRKCALTIIALCMVFSLIGLARQLDKLFESDRRAAAERKLNDENWRYIKKFIIPGEKWEVSVATTTEFMRLNDGDFHCVNNLLFKRKLK